MRVCALPDLRDLDCASYLVEMTTWLECELNRAEDECRTGNLCGYDLVQIRRSVAQAIAKLRTIRDVATHTQ